MSKPSQRTHHIHGDDKDDTPYGSEQLFNVGGRKSSPPLMVTVELSRAELQMEVDTGASLSIISHETYTKPWAEKDRPRLHHSARKLHTYTGEELVVKGKITVDVGYEDQRKSLPLYTGRRGKGSKPPRTRLVTPHTPRLARVAFAASSHTSGPAKYPRQPCRSIYR